MLHKKNFALADGTAMAITLTASFVPPSSAKHFGMRFQIQISTLGDEQGVFCKPCLVWHKRNCLLILFMIACDITHGNKEGKLGNMRLNQYAPKWSHLTKQYNKSRPIDQAQIEEGVRVAVKKKNTKHKVAYYLLWGYLKWIFKLSLSR